MIRPSAAALLLLAACASTPAGRDREAVRSVVTGVVHEIDHQRWNELGALFAPEVETDYTSLFGGAPVKQGSDALVAGWRGALARVTTQHLLGPIEVRVDGERATAACHVRALHHAKDAPGGELWEVLGHYLFELSKGGQGWKIERMKLETFVQTGNRELLKEASGR